MLDGEIDEAIASVQKAVALDPNGAEAELNLAIVLTYAGQNPEALAAMERVLQLDPKPRAQVFDYYGFVLYMNHQYEKALQALSQVQPEERSDLGLETLAMANARLGRMAEAHDAVAAILKRIPVQNLAGFRVVYAHHRRQQDLDHRLDALRVAGLPEWSFDFRGRAGGPPGRLRDTSPGRRADMGRTSTQWCTVCHGAECKRRFRPELAKRA